VPTSSGPKGHFRVGEIIQASSGVHYSGGRGDKRIVQRYEGDLQRWWEDDFRFTDYPETWYNEAGRFIGYGYMEFTPDTRTFTVKARTKSNGGVLKIYQGAKKGSDKDAPGDTMAQISKDGPTPLLATVHLPDTNNQYEVFTVPAAVTECGIHAFYVVLDTVPKKGNVYIDVMCFLQSLVPLEHILIDELLHSSGI